MEFSLKHLSVQIHEVVNIPQSQRQKCKRCGLWCHRPTLLGFDPPTQLRRQTGHSDEPSFRGNIRIWCESGSSDGIHSFGFYNGFLTCEQFPNAPSLLTSIWSTNCRCIFHSDTMNTRSSWHRSLWCHQQSSDTNDNLTVNIYCTWITGCGRDKLRNGAVQKYFVWWNSLYWSVYY